MLSLAPCIRPIQFRFRCSSHHVESHATEQTTTNIDPRAMGARPWLCGHTECRHVLSQQSSTNSSPLTLTYVICLKDGDCTCTPGRGSVPNQKKKHPTDCWNTPTFSSLAAGGDIVMHIQGRARPPRPSPSSSSARRSKIDAMSKGELAGDA